MDSEIEIIPEDFDSLSSLFSGTDTGLKWDLVFILPVWLKTWWQKFGRGTETYICLVKHNGRVTGLAPLQINQGIASIIGSVNVCDYQDFVVVPGSEGLFYNAVLDDLRRRGVKGLTLETIRPDSSIARYLLPLARQRPLPVEYRQVDVSFEMPLPAKWEDYLAALEGKQRHEIKRKIRNLQAMGDTGYQTIYKPEDIPAAIEMFLQMFPESRGDKAQFMTDDMKDYFRSLSLALAGIGVMRFGVLRAGDRPVAMVMYFDYNNNIYLYNSAYDPAFKSMSVGIISKARCIQDSIEQGKRIFDFLKGPEPYKAHLGGVEVPLYSCSIALS